MAIQSPTRADYLSSPAGKDTILLWPSEGRVSPCQATARPMRDCHDAVNENPLYLELSISSNGPFIYNSPSQLPFLLYKRVFSPWLYQACIRLPQLCVSNCIFLLLQNKLILLINLTDFLIVLGQLVAYLVTQSCPTLCDPMDCSPPSSFVHGILQSRILEWVAISFSNCFRLTLFKMAIITTNLIGKKDILLFALLLLLHGTLKWLNF